MFSANLFTNTMALGGKTFIEEQEAFHLPGMSGAMMAFHINSDCMTPMLNRGDMVLCRTIEHPDDVWDGDLYAVIAHGAAYVRRVRRCINRAGDLTHLELWTENGEINTSFRLSIDAVSKVLKVTNVMSEF
jgi:Peptidase S24-like